MARAGRRVEFENTNWLGAGRTTRFDVPGGGLLFPFLPLTTPTRL